MSLLLMLAVGTLPLCASADDLFKPSSWAAMATDLRASQPGDALVVVINQAAEASNLAQSSTQKSSDLGGTIGGGAVNESGAIRFASGFGGRGETRRSDRLLAQLSVTVEELLPNGDLAIVGRQAVEINGENTVIVVRGRIRPVDISPANQVLSTRVADAQISYDGKGFVSRGAKPGLISRLFGLFGLL